MCQEWNTEVPARYLGVREADRGAARHFTTLAPTPAAPSGNAEERTGARRDPLRHERTDARREGSDLHPRTLRRRPRYPMRLFLLASALLLLYPCPPAQAQAIDLSEGWRFRTGNDTTWAAPTSADTAWAPIRVGVPWEEAGHPGYDGYGWYRTSVVVPAAWRTSGNAYLEEEGELWLRLGLIDGADVAYVNGHRVGATGRLPPDYYGDWATGARLPRPRRRRPLGRGEHGRRPDLRCRRRRRDGGGAVPARPPHLARLLHRRTPTRARRRHLPPSAP